MVKRSIKSKSNRVSLKKKYKIIWKVKEHHKKKDKAAKKLGLNKKPKVEKDPGIPNDWPFKEQELKALELRRERALQDLEDKKAARKERAKKRKLGLLDDEDKNEDSSVGEEKAIVTTRKIDNPEKALYNELTKVIDASDVILEVLDARDPLGTRCPDMEKLVAAAGNNKHLVLLLNKIDLVPREAAEKWLKYLREELPTVAFKCSTQEQKSNLGWKSASKAKSRKANNLLQTSDCLGAETLIKLLKNYSRSHEKNLPPGLTHQQDQWDALCEFFNSPEFKKRSEANTNNRKNVRAPHVTGRTPFTVLQNDLSGPDENCDRIELYRKTHQNEKGWSSAEAELNWKIMVVNQYQYEQEGIEMTEDEIVAEVLGPANGYVKGLGMGQISILVTESHSNYMTK